jgi:hypothetical protein
LAIKGLCGRDGRDYGPPPFPTESNVARDTADGTPIKSPDQLAAYLESGCKPREAWRIGTEHEKFGFYKDGHSPVPYDGPKGIRALLEGMQSLLGWEPIFDGEAIIGLADPDRRRRHFAGTGWAVRTERRAAEVYPPDMPRNQFASRPGSAGR